MRLKVLPLHTAPSRPPPMPVVHASAPLDPAVVDRILDRVGRYPTVDASGSYDSASLQDLESRRGRATYLPQDPSNAWLYELVDALVIGANEAVWGFRLEALEPLQYSAYHPGDHFTVHTDFGFQHPHRVLTVAIQLSDGSDYDGGDLEFLGADYDLADPTAARASWGRVEGRAQRGRGTVCLFPAHLPHRVTPVTRGVRHTLVGWVHGRRAGADAP